MAVPAMLDGAVVLATARVADSRPTGAARHFRDGALQDSASFVHLALASYDGEPACYLFYCDEEWTVLNDLFVDSRAEAEVGAAREFDGVAFTDAV